MFKKHRNIGRRANRGWFYRTARILYEELHPEKVTKDVLTGKKSYQFCFSEGWFKGFKKRWDISLRTATKKSSKAPKTLEKTVVSWLKVNRRVSQPKSEQDKREIGRYNISEIPNMDQTPIAFEFLDDKTYDTKGTKTVRVKQARSGWEKRQATLMILVHADGIRRCKPFLIFHGSEGPKNSRMRSEAKRYHSGVVVKFNPKAWSNEMIMAAWIKEQYKFSSADYSKKESRLLVMDAFPGQKTAGIIDQLRRMNTVTSMIPGGCTGYVQPLDVAINAPLKRRIEELAEVYYDNHAAQFESGRYSLSDRRILLTRWVGKAWMEFHECDSSLIRNNFRLVGLTLAVDGSEDSFLQIRDLPDIKIGDWRRVIPEEQLPLPELGLGEAHDSSMEVVEDGLREGETLQQGADEQNGEYSDVESELSELTSSTVDSGADSDHASDEDISEDNAGAVDDLGSDVEYR